MSADRSAKLFASLLRTEVDGGEHVMDVDNDLTSADSWKQELLSIVDENENILDNCVELVESGPLIFLYLHWASRPTNVSAKLPGIEIEEIMELSAWIKDLFQKLCNKIVSHTLESFSGSYASEDSLSRFTLRLMSKSDIIMDLFLKPPLQVTQGIHVDNPVTKRQRHRENPDSSSMLDLAALDTGETMPIDDEFHDAFRALVEVLVIFGDEELTGRALAKATNFFVSSKNDSEFYLSEVLHFLTFASNWGDHDVLFSSWIKNWLKLTSEELKMSADLKRVLALDWLMKKCSKIDTLLFYVLKGTIDSHWLEILKILHYNWSCTVEEGALLKSTVLNILESTIDLPKLDHFEAEKRLQGILGLFFHWLREFSENQSGGDTWHYLGHFVNAKAIILQLANIPGCFVLMVHHIINFSCLLVESDEGIMEPAFTISGFADHTGRFTLPSKFSRQNLENKETLLLDELTSKNETNPRLKYSNKFLRDKKDKNNNDINVQLACLVREAVQCGTIEDLGKSAPSGESKVGIILYEILQRLSTPCVDSLTIEVYQNVLPKKVVHPRHNYILKITSRYNIFTKLLQIVLEAKEHPKETIKLAEIIRALLAQLYFTFFNLAQSELKLPKKKLPIPDTDERKLAEDLIRSLGYGGWIPLSLASIIQVFPLLNDRDVFEIIRISWNCVNEFLHNPEIIWEPSKTKGNEPKEMNPQFFGGIIDVSSKSGEEDEAESFQVKWKTPFWTIIRKNITTIGPYIRGIVSIDSMDLDDAYCL